MAKIDAEDKQTGLKRLETRLANEKKSLDEKRKEEDAVCVTESSSSWRYMFLVSVSRC